MCEFLRASMYRPCSYVRFCAAAFALLIGSSAISPAIAAVHMAVICNVEMGETLPVAPPCHSEVTEPVEESEAHLCCPSDTVFEATPVPRIHQDIQQSLVAIEHPRLIVVIRPIRDFGQELAEQVPRGIPPVGFPVLNASLLI